jgi:hypothetical protein
LDAMCHRFAKALALSIGDKPYVTSSESLTYPQKLRVGYGTSMV